MHDHYIEMDNRVIHKGRKIQHRTRTPGHTWWASIKPFKKKVAFKVGWIAENHRFLWYSSCLSLFLSASTAATYIFTAPTCTTTIIGLERLHCCYIYFHCSYLYNYYNWSWTLFLKCWNFIWFSTFHSEILKNSSTFPISLKEGIGVKGGPRTRLLSG